MLARASGSLAILLALSAPATAAELFGSLRDASGLAVADAAVEASDQGTGLRVKTITGDTGEFHFFALPPGSYALHIAKPGFASMVRTGIELRVADRVALSLTLQIGDLSQAVEVRAAAPLLQTTSGTESFVVDATKVSALPLDGRNFVPLVALSSGVALPPGSTGSPSVLPRINGSRPRTNEYIYDGISVLQPEPGQVAFYPVLDAIQEFRVQVNSYSAEYGRSNGGVIQVNTRAGTND